MHTDEENLCNAVEQVEGHDEEIDSINSLTNSCTNSTLSINDNFNTTTLNTPSTGKRRIFILEPAVFLILFAKNLSGTVFQNQLLYQTCIGVFNYTEDDCHPLLGITKNNIDSQKIEDEMQAYVSHILMVNSLIQSIIPAILSLFIGSWSDRYGRRPIVLATFIGFFLNLVILSMLSLISKSIVLNPWLFLLPAIPFVMVGGSCALIMSIYAYISDVTDGESKAKRMIYVDAALGAGTIIGSLVSSYIYAATSTVFVFILSTVIAGLSCVYVYLFKFEITNSEHMNASIWIKLREFFHFDLAKDLVRTCMKRRPRLDRAIIWMTVVSLVIIVFIIEGESNVNYFFFRKQFDFTLADYNLFNGERAIIQVIGCIIGLIVLRKISKFSVVTMALIALACCVLESSVRATAIHSWELYIGVAVGLLGGLISSMLRAILSFVAPSSEVGKIFAMTISLETLSPLGSAPLYTIVYNATLQTYAGAYNFISAGLNLLCYIFTAIIFGIKIACLDYQKTGI